ncbi:Vms1/Ankzf1 family peptidyl-tRNA hydrolase [Methanolobus sp. WCC4]|uniref:Vms1/Ankzf1 family peptidyl-tRNA hydrolase n=1 Tax=Methanolobus sp. WCC4 TaxID=3125784 RepID=UPI0030F80691
MIEKEKIVGNISSVFNRYTGKEEMEHEINKLRSHIVELELDVRTANIRYEKSSESEKKAVAARQEAEEKLKAAEVRLLTLEHELEKQRTDSPSELSFNRVDQFSRERTTEFLRSLSSFKHTSGSLITVHVAAGEQLDGIKDSEALMELIDGETLAMAEKVVSTTGYVLFYSPDHLVNELIVPPLPVKGSNWNTGDTFDTGTLTGLLKEEMSLCVLVAHAGESFVGYSLDSEEFDSFQVIKSSVKAKHGKGGFSQRRFERLRDEDIAHHIDKVKLALKDMFDELEGSVDRLFIAGDPQLAKEMTTVVPLDIEQIFSSSDIRIEKHNISEIMKQLLVCRRYRF